MKNIKKILKNKENMVIIIVSLIALIAGFFAIGFLPSILIIGGADAFLFLPDLIKKKKHSPKKKPNSKNSKKKKKIIKILLLIGLILFIIVTLLCSAFAFYIVKNADKFDPDKLYKQEASILYDINGEIFAKLGTEKREKITYDELPEVLIDAIVATEDSRFFQHNGFDLPRFLKASIKQVLTRRGGGASTITMQVAKNNLTSTKQTITRKFTDIYVSIFQIEKNYTKKEILEFYVNAPYLGSGAYGVEQACQTYFGKSAKDINLAEAALIAGLFQAPDSYDPNNNPEKAEQRRNQVLYLMERHGYISKEEKEAASQIEVSSMIYKSTTQNKNKYQSFIDTVTAEIFSKTKKDPYVVPMEIYTTMDPTKQAHIDAIISGETFKWDNEFVDAGISVLDIKTGAIIAIGSGRESVTAKRTFNNATSLNNQIGSTSKPIYDYGPSIEYENWSTGQLFMDEEYTYSDGTKIQNWDRKYNGLMTMRTALDQSRNIPALKAFQSNKNSNIKKFATGLGLSPEIQGDMLHEAHAIGGYNGENPLSMSAAFAAFGNGGYYIKPYSYTKIIFRDNGEVLENKPVKSKAMSEETSYMMSNLLQSSAIGGLRNYANINNTTYGAKTGTSNFSQATIDKNQLKGDVVNDLWVNGVSPDYAISVWYGYKKINPKFTNNSYTASHLRLFQTVAKGIFKAGSNFVKPEGVIEVEIEKETNPVKLPSQFTPANMRSVELFKKGTEPTEVSDRFNTLDNVKNLTSSINGNTLTLKWNAAASAPITDDYITSWAKSLAKSDNGINSLVAGRKSYNNSYIGTVTYNIYSKSSTGELTLLKTSDKTTIDIQIKPTDSTTYVVKTVYSIFKNNISTGSEVKISMNNVDSVITSELKGTNTINLKIGEPIYIDPSPAVIVMENLTNVTAKATIKKVIKNSSGVEITADKMVTTKAETYTITYSITYLKYTDTLTRTIIIEA